MFQVLVSSLISRYRHKPGHSLLCVGVLPTVCKHFAYSTLCCLGVQYI